MRSNFILKCDISEVSTEFSGCLTMSLYYAWLEYEYLTASPIHFMVSAFVTVFYVVVVFLSFIEFHSVHVQFSIQQRLREIQWKFMEIITYVALPIFHSIPNLQPFAAFLKPDFHLLNTITLLCPASVINFCSTVWKVSPGRKLGQLQGSSNLFSFSQSLAENTLWIVI